jgi:3-methyladenine DNA glycosylase AlkC
MIHDMGIKAATSFSLKDQLFNADSVALLAAALARAQPGFPRARFERAVLARFPELELKQRIQWLVTNLENNLPGDFPQALEVLRRALPAPLDPTLRDDDFGQFIWVVPGEYVAKHGCKDSHLAASLAFLREATMRFSSESALRPFLQRYPQATLRFVHACAEDANYHVRRLASEGIRPFLPWALRVQLPPAEVVAVLDKLHADPTRYVTRSVANTLNDVSRVDPALALETVRRWHVADAQRPEELGWMTRHALRTLVKQGDAATLALLGFDASPQFRLSGIKTSRQVRVGDVFEWRASLRAATSQRLRIDLRLHFLKSNGRHLPKVFSIADASVEAGETLAIHKRLRLQPATTRTLYPGKHFAELVVNGATTHRSSFELII